MKRENIFQENFRELTATESYACNGGGFAYDVGRFIRFVAIANGGDGGLAIAISDACYNSIQ